MVSKVSAEAIHLNAGEAYALPREAVQTICAGNHALWLSQAGRHEDIVLAGGRCITLHGRALIVAQALGERTSFRICRISPQQTVFAERVTRAARVLRNWFGRSARMFGAGRTA